MRLEEKYRMLFPMRARPSARIGKLTAGFVPFKRVLHKFLFSFPGNKALRFDIVPLFYLPQGTFDIQFCVYKYTYLIYRIIQ
jgi:hypothetical protein